MNPNDKYAYTKPCKNVSTVDNKETPGVYGKCYKEICNFAHSLEEFRLVSCNFDEKCINEYCGYFHPSCEDKKQYFKRTKKQIPNLPVDNSLSRVKKSPKKKEDIKLIINIESDDEVDVVEIKEEIGCKSEEEYKIEQLQLSVVESFIRNFVYIYKKDEENTIKILEEKDIKNYQIMYLD